MPDPLSARMPHARRGAHPDFDAPLDRSLYSTLKWEMEAQRLGRADLLGMGTADLDFRSPPAVIEALERTARAGHFGYPHKSDGYYAAMTGFYARHFGWEIERSWISHNVGIYPSMRPLIDQLTAEGDEVIYQPPVHFQFPAVVAAAGRVPVANPLVIRNGRYEMDLAQLEARISGRTRLLLLCNPHNPVGRVWTRDELRALSEICARHGVVVVSDEVYCGLLFPAVAFTPYATVSPEAAMHSVALVSASKMFNLTGLKHSQVVAANPVLLGAYQEGLRRDTLSYGGSVFGQVGAEVAYRDCDDWLAALMVYIAGNYRFAEDYVAEHLPLARCIRPESTYFMWLNLAGYNLSRAELQERVETGQGLIVNYGEDMGTGGEGYIRINLGTQRALVEEGLGRLSRALSAR